jgi:hypothetical protein
MVQIDFPKDSRPKEGKVGSKPVTRGGVTQPDRVDMLRQDRER